MPIENRLIVRVLTTTTAPGLYTFNSCERVLKATNGFTNVINHLKRFHPAYEEEAEAALRNPNLLSLRLVDQRTSDIYRWIEWIVMDCLPLSFCERDLVCHNSKLSRISVPTVKRYLDGVVDLVAQRISTMLPATFGIVLDGWTSNGRHYETIFAVFNDPDMHVATNTRSSDYHDDLECHTRRFVLLAFCPMENEEDLSAQSLFDLVADTLSRYEQPWDAVAFMVGDNCSVNQAIGRRAGAIPLIGCASHRFALAVRDFMEQYDELIAKVHALMKKLSTIKGRAILRRVTELSPVMKNDTRWSSVYDMVKRYVEIEPALESLDHGTIATFDLLTLLPTRSEKLTIRELLADLENFQSVTAELQRPTLTLSAVRRLFDHTLDQYTQLKARLLPSAALVTYPALETGLVKIQRSETLNSAEWTACAAFSRPANDGEESKSDQGDAVSFASRAFKKRKVIRRPAFVDVGFVPPTSNECERFFSRAKMVYNDLRKSMDPVTFETLMFLHCNRELWDVYSVESVRNGLGRNAEN